MGVPRWFSAIAVGALVSATLSVVSVTTADAGPVPTSTAVGSSDGTVVAAPEDARSQRSARAVRRYWTSERMRAAVPIEELLPSLTGSTSYDETTAQRTAARRVRPPRTSGKLFFNVDGANAVCSAAAIRTKKRNQVITAGHCVHTGPNVGLLQQPHFYRDWVFVPRYRNGRAPYGKWVSNNAWAFNGWVEREAFRFDQAIISFKRRHGRRLVNVIGGNEVVWGKDPRQWGTRIWGWPAQAPYDGETAKRCDGRTTQFEDTADAAMHNCPLTGGASGGPWFLPRGRTANTGRIWAVTSRRLLDRPVLLARPIPREIRRMIRTANR
jgi:V8-like Glu-specific endopeptidase